MQHHLARFSLVVALAGALALVPRGSGAGAQALTPPPPPGAICQTTGNGTFCHGSFPLGGTNVDTGISCASFEVLNTFTGTNTYQLRYDSTGLPFEATFHVNSPQTYINSVTGKAITADVHFTLTRVFAIPGDRSTVTTTLTGAVNISTGNSLGLVTHDVGKVVFDPSGDILFEGGPHDQLDNPTAFEQAVCAELS